MIKKLYRWFLLAVFLIVWFWSWHNSASSQNWFLENQLIFLFLPFIAFLMWYIKLSKLSLSLITIFMMLHVIGAHYNYGSVPFGNIIGQFLGTPNNVYDKVVHFSFGFLIVYPVRELVLRVVGIRGFWGYFIPLNIILSLSAFYEILEWASVANIDPALGYLFIGGSDPFDASKDMAAAGLGAVIVLIILAIFSAKFSKNFGARIKNSFIRDKEEFPKEDAFLHTSDNV